MFYQGQITGQVIHDLRKASNLSQECLSGLAGIARSHLSAIERGKKNVEVETLWRIAEALDMKLSELIQLVEEEHSKQA